MGFESQYDEPLEFGSSRILSAFQDRQTVTTAVDFLDAYLNGTWAIKLSDWSGCANAPTECEPEGMLTVTGNDLYQILHYTDKNAKFAYLTALNGTLVDWVYPLDGSQVLEDGTIKIPTLLDNGLVIEAEAVVYTKEQIDAFFANGEPYYEFPTVDPETGDDVVHRLVFNGKGVLVTDEAPEYRKVRRNWRRHDEALAEGTSLNSLFIPVPENEGNYLYLNGVDYYKADQIEAMIDIPSEIEGQAYVMTETAGRFGRQTIIVPETGKMWARSKKEDGTITEWVKIGASDNIPQENVIDLVQDLLDLNNRIFSVEESDNLQAQTIRNLETQIGYIAAINNQQTVAIDALTAALNALSTAQGDYVPLSALSGGDLGAVLVRDGDEGYSFKRTHAARVITSSMPQAKVGEYFSYNIPISSIVKPEFVWEDLVVSLQTYPDSWLQMSYTLNNGIDLYGTPTEQGREIAFVLLECNGFVSTYPLLIQTVDEVTAPSGLIASLTQNFPPIALIEWQNVGSTPDGFLVYRRDNGGAWFFLAETANDVLSYEDNALNYSSNTDYQVKARFGGISGAGSNIASVQTMPQPLSGGLYGRYFRNIDLSGIPYATQVDPILNFNWNGEPPLAGIDGQNFSVRWSGFLKWPTTGTVSLRTRSDDGVRVWVNGVKVVDEWRAFPISTFGFTAALVGGVEKPIVIEYFQGGGGSAMYLEYLTPNGAWEIVPSGYILPDSSEGVDLTPPVLTSVTAVDSDTLTVAWDYSGEVSGFTLQRALVNSPSAIWITVAAPEAADRSATINSLQAGATCYFRLSATYNGRTTGYSNVLSGTTTSTGTNPLAFEKYKREIWWTSPSFDWSDLSQDAGIIERANYAGVAAATIFIDWWEVEQAENSFNFDELKWRIEKQKENGLGFIVVIPHRYAYKLKVGETNGGMIGLSTQHRWNGSTWSTVRIPPSNCAYMTYEEAATGTNGWLVDGIQGAYGSTASATYMAAHERWIAKVSDWIQSNEEYRSIFRGFIYADGGSTETGLSTAASAYDFTQANPQINGFQAADMRWDFRQRFATFLQSKYGTLSAANAAWGQSPGTDSWDVFPVMTWMYLPPVYNASGDMGVVAYNQSTPTWDWFLFLIDQKRQKYARVINAIKKPSSVVSGLVSSTDFQTIAYLTESLSTAQGYTWGACAIEALKDFDVVLSSSGSNGGAVGSDSHFKSFKLRASQLRGTIPSKIFGQELDTDQYLFSDGGRVAPSKTMRVIMGEGATYFVVTFFRDTASWDEANYLSTDGQTRSFKEDVRLGFVDYISGKTRALPAISSTLQYNYDHLKANVANPNNAISSFIAQTNPNEAGISSTYIDIQLTR